MYIYIYIKTFQGHATAVQNRLGKKTCELVGHTAPCMLSRHFITAAGLVQDLETKKPTTDAKTFDKLGSCSECGIYI